MKTTDHKHERVDDGTLYSWKGTDNDGRVFTASVLMPDNNEGVCHLRGAYDDGEGKKIDKRVPRIMLESMWKLRNMMGDGSNGFNIHMSHGNMPGEYN